MGRGLEGTFLQRRQQVRETSRKQQVLAGTWRNGDPRALLAALRAGAAAVENGVVSPDKMKPRFTM